MISTYPKNRFAFDIGNVICHLDFTPLINEMILQNLCESEADAMEFCRDIQGRHDVGLIDFSQALRLFFPGISKEQGIKIRDAWLTVVTPSVPMLNVLAELIAEKASVALLSNIGFDHAKYLSDICPQFQYCIKHFSCYVGARKPTKLFFQSFVRDNPQFEQRIFVENLNIGKFSHIKKSAHYRGMFFDDLMENVESAKPYLDSSYFNIQNFDSDEEAAAEMVKLLKL